MTGVGKLREKLVVNEKTGTGQDSSGSVTIGGGFTVHANSPIWGRIVPREKRDTLLEQHDAGSDVPLVVLDVQLHRNTWLTSTMQIVWESQTYDVMSVVQTEDRRYTNIVMRVLRPV